MGKDRLLEFYMIGFNNEIDFGNTLKYDMHKKAYLLGKKHSEAGDTLESTEYLTDDIVEFLIEKDSLNN